MKAPFFPNVRYWWIGSDPEYLYYGQRQHITIDLSPLVADKREQRVGCFIGTDGHAMNAEIRPAPCRNVYLHVAHVADAVNKIKQNLAAWGERNSAYADITMLASPEFAGELCGGHVHVSFFVRDPLLLDLATEGVVPLDPFNVAPVLHRDFMASNRMSLLLQEYWNAGGGFSLNRFMDKIRYLGESFEDALFAPHNRRRKGGVPQPVFRMANAHTAIEKKMIKEGFNRGEVYLRLEWRQPSTWLRDPHTAYCYLALVKFAVLNAHLIPSPYKERDDEEPKECFTRRLAKIMGKGAKLTPDLSALPSRAFEVLRTRSQAHPWLVDYDAWERYRAT